MRNAKRVRTPSPIPSGWSVADGQRQQAYVERIVQPNLPDEAEEPRRMRGILATLILGLVAYAISSMLLAGVREHKD